ncbi:hypothetical protein MMC26_007656 [Xylographa opegraphella]|nr:hypothetical protein [Xylographa opegraphella]
MFDIVGVVSTYVSQYRPYVVQNRMFLAALLFVPIAREVYVDYCAWYALGPGGIPHNFAGYVTQWLLSWIAVKNPRSITSLYFPNRTDLDKESFLEGDLPEREGTRPKIATYVAPHRQLTDKSTAELEQLLGSSVRKIAEDNALITEIMPSILEGGSSPALSILESVYTESHLHVPRAPREVFHMHAGEGSAHGIYSWTDAVMIIEKGWGEMHGLSGQALGFPHSYLMIYAPRNAEEVKVVSMLARAAVRYGSEGKNVS